MALLFSSLAMSWTLSMKVWLLMYSIPPRLKYLWPSILPTTTGLLELGWFACSAAIYLHPSNPSTYRFILAWLSPSDRCNRVLSITIHHNIQVFSSILHLFVQ
jgi:hypothetical protein